VAGGAYKLFTKNVTSKFKGSITVFLSLILMLIMALLCTVIEGARINAAKVHFRRAFSTALDSALAGYYAPLWDEYHVFGLNTGSGDYKGRAEFLARTVKEYMEYTLKPDKNLDGGASEMGLDLFGFDGLDVSVQSQTGLLDYEGALFINQAVEYMKYAEIENGLELLLDKLSMLEQPALVSYIMEEKQSVEEELVRIDEEILNLMRLYDGLMTNKKGVVLDENGAVKTSQTFIKRICYAGITMDNVGINNVMLFELQKDKYINPETEYFSKINSSFMKIENYQKNIEEMNSRIMDLENQLAHSQAHLDSLSSKQEKTEADKEAIKNLLNVIKALKDEVKSLNEQIKELKAQIQGELAYIISICDSLDKFIGELLPFYDEAMASINIILEKRKAAVPLINGYENQLKSRKGSLSEELYEGLEDELKDLKKYIDSDSNSYDFYEMQKILEDNKKLLTAVRSLLAGGRQALENGAYIAAAKGLGDAKTRLSDYRIQGLALDYSCLVYERDKKNEALKKVAEAISGGISSLVINPEDISDALIGDRDDFPSFLYSITDGKSNYSETVEAFFAKSDKDDRNSSAGKLFGKLGNEYGIMHVLSVGMDNLAKMFLFREYVGEHFYSYKPENLIPKNKKPTAINYEQEYLVIGKRADADNLNAVIARIILIRMIFDFISVMSDKSIRNEAKLIAAAIVGFTGLPILVKITQILILLAWSFAEALLDTAAIMMGKKVEIYKKKVDTSFADILLITREQLILRASALPEAKELSLGYDEYLKIFLFMTDTKTLAYRSMDLIQENIRLRYGDEKFKIADCLYGFELSAGFEIEGRFTGFSFLQDYYFGKNSYQFCFLAADCY